jgi:AcrR family transcriptional regulator
MPKIVDHDQYREELLTQSFDLFAKKGYASITMRQLAEGLGVSTGTLYHYFPSKRVLFEQLIDQLSQQDMLRATAELKNSQTLTERMYIVGEFLAENEDYFLKQTYLMMDFYQHEDFEKVRNHVPFQKAYERYQQAISDYIGISDPALIRFVLANIDGLILHRIYGNETFSIREQVLLLGNMIMLYLESALTTDKQERIL